MISVGPLGALYKAQTAERLPYISGQYGSSQSVTGFCCFKINYFSLISKLRFIFLIK